MKGIAHPKEEIPKSFKFNAGEGGCVWTLKPSKIVQTLTRP